MDRSSTAHVAWWGSTRIACDEQKRWVIGPLRLRVARLAGAWRIRFSSGRDPHEDALSLAESESPDTPAQADEQTFRFADRGSEGEITLVPRLADRPVVSHPNEPFFVLPGDEARLYVGSPLWLELRVDETRKLVELPILRPSDTWIGPLTGIGEAGYSSRTFCRTRLVDLPYRPHRSVTLVHVCNHALEPLRLDRIVVAVPHLSLFASKEGRLWTESIRLTRELDDSRVNVEIAGTSDEAVGSTLVSSPREPAPDSRLLRAVDFLF